MSILLWGFSGVVAAAGVLLLIRKMPAESQRIVMAIGLAVAASIYAAFAIVGDVESWIRVELVASLTFSLLAALAAHWSLALALGWMLHVGWDLMHHQLLGAAVAPRWYPAFCITFDVVVALYFLQLGVKEFRRRR